MTPEGHVKKRVKELLARYDRIWTHWPVQTGYGAATLDCTGARKGQAFAIETKAPNAELTRRQEDTIKEMRDAGIAVFVIGQAEYQTDDGKIITYEGLPDLELWLDQL